MSEREKLYIDAHYEQFVNGNLEAARKAYELWAQTYPRDEIPPRLLSVIYSVLGDYDKALARHQEARKLNPGSGLAFVESPHRLLHGQSSGRSQGYRTGGDSPQSGQSRVHLSLYQIDFLQHDAAGMEREAAGLMGTRMGKTTFSTPNPIRLPIAGSLPKRGS